LNNGAIGLDAAVLPSFVSSLFSWIAHAAAWVFIGYVLAGQRRL
jgi:hypothetical protein